MKENYKAWELNITDFDKLQTEQNRLEFLIRFAVLAPSSHNTQPWRFRISDNIIKVYREISRRLPIADINDRQLFLSIGCAIENITMAADYYGYSTDVQYTKDFSDEHLVAMIIFNRVNFKPSKNNHLIHSIVTRKTNRGKYKNQFIDEKILQDITSITTRDVKIFLVNDKSVMSKLADIAVLASIESMVGDEFRYELSHHLKHNMTHSKIGMPGFSLGLPTPISFILPHLIKRFNMEKVAQKQNELLFKKHTPYIIIITTIGDERKSWLDAGRAFQHLALIATKHSVSLSPWGAPIQIGEFYKDIQKSIHTEERPQMFFRMGYATKSVKNSPRIPYNEVIQ